MALRKIDYEKSAKNKKKRPCEGYEIGVTLHTEKF